VLEVIAAVSLALASGAFVLAAFAWVRAGQGAQRAAPVRAAGTPSPPVSGTSADPAPPRAAPASPYATDPAVLLRLEALERRALEDATARSLGDDVPAPRSEAAGEAQAPVSSAPSPAVSPAARAARGGWRAFP
jgi:hypothetical protein